MHVEQGDSKEHSASIPNKWLFVVMRAAQCRPFVPPFGHLLQIFVDRTDALRRKKLTKDAIESHLHVKWTIYVTVQK